MSIELAERLMRLIPELKPMALSGDSFSNAIAFGRAETASWLMDLGAEVDVAMQATLFSHGWRNLLFDPSDACTALANRMMASSPKLKADAESFDALISALESRNALAANRCMELGGAIDAEVGAKLLLTENGSAQVGDQVEVRSGGKEMPSEAKVTAINKGDGTYHVKYDDNGREDDVKSSLVRSISTWRKLFFDPRDEWVVLTDRLMESNAELKRALSSKTLLAALETRALIAANRLINMNVLLDDDACSKFVEPFKNEGVVVGARVQVRADGKSSFSPGKIVYSQYGVVFGIEYDDGTNEMRVYSDRIRSLESGGGSWRKLLFDPSDECGALANRLARSIPRLKEAAISEETLTAALRFSNAIASNRLFGMMDRKLDDTTGATFLAAGGLGTTQSHYLTWLREKVEVGSRVKAIRSVQDSNSGEFYPGRVSRLRGEKSFDIDFDDGEFESKVSSGSVRKVPPAAANQICGSAFRSLVLGQSHECVALVDRLLAQDSALRQPALIVSVLDGNASASHRFLNLGAEVDASVFEAFLHGQGWNKAVASESCASLVERLVERDAKLGQHAVLIALRAGQYHLALTLLRDLRVPVKGEVLTYLMCKRGSTTLWHEIVQDEDSSAKAVIAELANQSEELLNVRDGNNRLAYNMGTEQAREAMRVAFFCGRYKMSIALHTSATCRVLLATDMQHLEEPSVVIKLMLNRDQFEREVAAREQGLDREFVVPILQTSDDDEIKDLWLLAVTELNYPEYRYGIIMEYADRNLDAIMRQVGPFDASSVEICQSL